MHHLIATLVVSPLLAIANPPAATEPAPAPAVAAPVQDPRGPAADPAIAPLAFMTGTWILHQANGAMIEETWGEPRGKTILGSFRRVLGNGVTPFYEFTQIVAGKDTVTLRQIHVHGNFDTDPRRAVPMTLKLDRIDETSVSFVPVDDPELAKSGTLDRVTYTRVDPTTLLLVVEPKPAKEGAAPQPPLEFRMTLAKP